MIVLSNISKVFDNGKQALTAVDNVNLTIEQGQIYGIIGYSGAGKSTLIRLLNGLEKPSAGSVTINGQDISAAKGEAAASGTPENQHGVPALQPACGRAR